MENTMSQIPKKGFIKTPKGVFHFQLSLSCRYYVLLADGLNERVDYLKIGDEVYIISSEHTFHAMALTADGEQYGNAVAEFIITNDDVEKYNNLIDRKMQKMSDPHWANIDSAAAVNEGLLDKLTDYFQEGAVYSESTIYELWNQFVGSCFDNELYHAFLEKAKGEEILLEPYSIQDYFSFINELKCDVIDYGGYGNCSDIETCSHTNEVLNSFPSNWKGIKEELELRYDKTGIDQDTWNYLYLVNANHTIALLYKYFSLFEKYLANEL